MSNSDTNASDVTLLFLHGVGTGDKENEWLVALNAALQRLGYPELPSARVLAPKYPHGLDGVDGEYAIPPITLAAVGGDEAKHHRRRFERRLSAMEVRLGHHEGGSGFPLAAYVVGKAALPR